MKKNKLFTLLSVLLILAFVFTACQSAPVEPTQEETSEEEVDTTGEEETAAEADETTNEVETVSEATTECPAITLAYLQGFTSEYPGQFEVDEYQAATGCEMVYKSNPMFDGQDLPPVEERLPENPLVLVPYEDIGLYGGTLNGTSFAPESGTSDILSWRHVSLVRISDDLQTILPNVASAWDVNADNTEFTFYLRKGIKWSDGEPFTVDDMMFWYEDIKLNQELNPDNAPDFVMEKIDNYTVKYTFEAPNYAFLISQGTNAYAQPWQPKHFLSQFHIDYNSDANTIAEEEGYEDWTGLFRSYYHDWKDSYHRLGVPTLESHVVIEETTEYRRLEANPYYFKVDPTGQQLPYIDYHYERFISDTEVANLAIINGEVDLKGQGMELTSYPLLKENEATGDYIVQLPPAGLGKSMAYWFNVNHKDPVKQELFQNTQFLQAMSLAINRAEINELIYLGLGAPIAGLPADPASVPFVSEEQATHMTEYDPDAANTLLDEVGMEVGPDGFRTAPDGSDFLIYLEYAQQAGPVLMQELIKSYWEDVGIRVELKEVSSEAYRTRIITNDHDVANWHNDGTSLPAITADTSAFYPPVTGGSFGFPGPWQPWFDSGGTEGERPPDYVVEQYEKAELLKTLEPGSDEWMALGSELIDTYLEHMWSIGTVGYVPSPVVVSNRLGNTTTWSVILWDYYWEYPFRVEQFYIKE
ncbi:MAG: ABC transporter substrate-binding protein [Anaerolineales bacterium]|nr:ABC transporter substrate-binding protein [Anaerolineales bacterium]